MFASTKELEKVKVELETLKDDTAILNERFSAHIVMQEQNHTSQENKMDEIIGLVKESHARISDTAVKIHDDIIDRVTREYSRTATVDTKIADMKNCVRREFVTKESADTARNEIEKDIRGVTNISKSHYASIRREAYLAVIIVSGLVSAYLNFYNLD